MTVTLPRTRVYFATAAASLLMVAGMFLAGLALLRASQSAADTRRAAQAAQANAAQTHAALCTLRADLQHRADTTTNYLATHPQKTILGVPRQTLVNNLRNQQATLRSLNGLGC